MALLHITPQGRIMACSASVCKYRKQDHFPTRELAKQALTIRKAHGFQELALPRSATKIPPKERARLQELAKKANSAEDYIDLGTIFYRVLTPTLPFPALTATDPFKAEEIELAVQRSFKQLVATDRPLTPMKGVKSDLTSLDFIPNRVKTLLKNEKLVLVPSRREDNLLHGIHTAYPQGKIPSVVTEEVGDFNIWVRDKKTHEMLWWGEEPRHTGFKRIARAVRLITKEGGHTLTRGGLYSLTPKLDESVFIALPQQNAAAPTFFLHQYVHLLQRKAVLSAEGDFWRWASVKKYSETAQAAVWHGFPLDQMGLSPQEFLPVLTEAFFLPTHQAFKNLYPSDQNDASEILRYGAGFWLALGHQKLCKS